MARDPLREWQERYADYGTRLWFKPEPGAPFSFSVEPICHSPGIVRTRLSPGLLGRGKDLIQDGNDNLSLVVALAPGLNFWHLGREVCLGRNEATIVRDDEPGKAGTREQFEFVEVRVPRREWRMRSPRAGEDLLAKVVKRNSEGLKLLLGYIAMLAKTGTPAFAEARDAVQRHLIDLTVLAATEPCLGESEDGCVRAARRAAVLEYIADHFQDPRLSGSTLAHALGISQRYLQRLLQETGKSFTEHVNELRLARAFVLLGCGGDRRVSDIAFEVGFSDLAYFYRLFRARFGDTPKGVRGSLKASPAD